MFSQDDADDDKDGEDSEYFPDNEKPSKTKAMKVTVKEPAASEQLPHEGIVMSEEEAEPEEEHIIDTRSKPLQMSKEQAPLEEDED
jgi:hypothetical protein